MGSVKFKSQKSKVKIGLVAFTQRRKGNAKTQRKTSLCVFAFPLRLCVKATNPILTFDFFDF